MDLRLKIEPAVDDLATALALLALLSALAAKTEPDTAKNLDAAIRYRLRRMAKATEH